MNTWAIIILIILFILFVCCSIIWDRLSLKDVFDDYMQNYKGGKINNIGIQKRRNSWGAILCLGILPYFMGIIFFWSFYDITISFDLDSLFQINIIILTILCLFYGLNGNFKNKRIYKETSAVIIVSILLILINSFLILFLMSICDKLMIEILSSIFWAIEFKMIISFLYVIRRINLLNNDNDERR